VSLCQGVRGGIPQRNYYVYIDTRPAPVLVFAYIGAVANDSITPPPSLSPGSVRGRAPTEHLRSGPYMSTAYRSMGSIEGRIELVSTRARRFSVTEERTNRLVPCNLPDELEESVSRAIIEKRRVVVSGIISYNAKNEPTSVQVRPPIRFLGTPEELPSSQDLAGADPDFSDSLL
jgi:hypothetical protein